MRWVPGGWLTRCTAVLIALVTIVASFAVLAGSPAERSAGAGEARVHATASTTVATTSTSSPPTTEAPTTGVPPTTEAPTTEPPPTTEAPTTEPPTTAAPAPPPAAVIQSAGPLPSPGRWTADAYAGLGTWIDVFDWSATFTNGNPQISFDDIDRMAALGVQTVYVQAARWDVDTGVVEEDRLVPLIERARADGMRVVGWYLPDLGDIDADYRHLLAIARLPVDGLAVDIESRKVPDVAERNQRLLALSGALREGLAGQVLSAIVLPPVLMEDVNPNYWPDYPWAGLAPFYDVWQPMNYWTGRLPEWRDAYRYTAVDVQRVRDHIGRPDAIVHPIGGIADEVTPDQVAAMLQAAVDTGCVGGSLYDYRTTGDDLWSALQGFRVA